MHPAEHKSPTEDAALKRLIAANLPSLHAKTIALCEGTFEVLADIPAAYRVGLFAEPKTYSCYVRLSNVSPVVQPDEVKDVRGLAIKLLHVPGAKVAASTEAGSQDFVLSTTPVVHVGTAARLAARARDPLFALKRVLSGQWRALATGGTRPSSLLNLRYHSGVAYAFGDKLAVKYLLVPVAAAPVPRRHPVQDDFLSAQAQAQLHCMDVAFDFCVQVGRAGLSVEDASVRWSEQEAPPVVLARLSLPRQTFRTKERRALAASLCFDPVHALEVHRPIGSLNRAGEALYKARRSRT
ncbi:hypothetical protein ACHHYP_00759 [Achlya hypogyna]|uniref:Uncharacterized protein n=1 Tax=Achlya hypogyna TaxID=1202772 RepID=A0A1V9ZTY8_ACHHY|nr:hypothetical protein ACHHYP_00759 [Achlya hypogyna]